MVSEIVISWIEELCSSHKVNNLCDVPKNILEEEISEVKGTIDNCIIFEDTLGAVYNKEYLELLNEAAGVTSTKDTNYEVEAIIRYLEDAIKEMRDDIDDEENGYDDLERHDCAVALAVYEDVLSYIIRKQAKVWKK